MLWVSAAGVVFGAFALFYWIWLRLIVDIISLLQGLVDKMKEYDLDARAGLMICRGRDLQIYYMDSALQKLLGTVVCVNDVLPESTRERHQQLIKRYVGTQPLPESLKHPLRNVQILTKDKTVVQAKLIIGKLVDRQSLSFFYVIVQVSQPSLRGVQALWRNSSSFSSRKFNRTSTSDLDCENRNDLHGEGTTKSRSEASSPELIQDEVQGVGEMYGLGAASYIEHGLVPATERYAQATVLYMDIVDFTSQCMAKPLDEISDWMTRIHATVDELLERYAVRKVETRGDCVICVSGTNYAPSEGAGSRDLCGDQVTRMLSFGHDLGLALAAIEGTAARIGMATGPVVLTHIAHGGDALPAKYIYGDTVNVACRMEQTGRVGAVHLTEAAARAYAEERGVAVPPLRRTQVKSKGMLKTALYDYAAGRFLDGREERAAPPATAAAPPVSVGIE